MVLFFSCFFSENVDWVDHPHNDFTSKQSLGNIFIPNVWNVKFCPGVVFQKNKILFISFYDHMIEILKGDVINSNDKSMNYKLLINLTYTTLNCMQSYLLRSWKNELFVTPCTVGWLITLIKPWFARPSK